MQPEAPNLDCLDEDDLREFIDRIASYGFPQPAGDNLERYARGKLLAIENRKAGKIQEAAFFESMCDSIYRKIPGVYRW